ncbi:MAG: phosphate acetyltransferase, partial [Muribaculaceae bacterium]|nr:phosphate acetyltransferase [Muribaculaceae bacterium]
MTLFERLTAKAKENPQRLVLPESLEPRTLKAADFILENGIADVTFLGKAEAIHAKADELELVNIKKAHIYDPDDMEFTEKYAELLCELRKKQGMTIDDARYHVKNPLSLGCLMIKNGDIDCMVAGALSPTSSVLRAAF